MLHIHALLFGKLNPDLVCKCAENPELRKKVCQTIDSIISGSLKGYEEERSKAQAMREKKAQMFKANFQASSAHSHNPAESVDAQGVLLTPVLLPLVSI